MTWRALVLVWMMTLGACATYRPQPLAMVLAPDRVLTQGDGAVRVTVAVLSPEESATVFGVAVYGAAVQPVWLNIENHDGVPYLLFPSTVDPNKFSPLEAAYRNHHRLSFFTPANVDGPGQPGHWGSVYPTDVASHHPPH